MFRGHFEHAIDAKGRTSVPARFRDVLAATGDAPATGDPRVIITKSPFDACLHLLPMKGWEEIEAKIAAQPQFDPHVIRLRRMYISAAVECEIDGSGRLLVPGALREYASLHKDVLWAGMGNMVELWSREKWDETQKMTPEELVEFRRVVSEQLRI
jgi:MraZ protein